MRSVPSSRFGFLDDSAVKGSVHPLAPRALRRVFQRLGLGTATPTEIQFGRVRAHLSVTLPLQGRPGHAVPLPRFEISFLDSERRLLLLLRKAE